MNLYFKLQEIQSEFTYYEILGELAKQAQNNSKLNKQDENLRASRDWQELANKLYQAKLLAKDCFL